MKVLVVFLLCAVAARTQAETWCRCAAFTTYDFAQEMVWEGEEILIDSCEDEKQQCKKSCTKQLSTSSNDGDLWYLTENGLTVGQHICDSLVGLFHPAVHNHYVYGYYEICGGAWQYTGVTSQQMLCCEGGQHIHCVS